MHLVFYLPWYVWVKYAHQSKVRSQSKHQAVFLLCWNQYRIVQKVIHLVFSNFSEVAFFRVGFHMVIFEPSKKLVRCGMRFRDCCISIWIASVMRSAISIDFNVRILTFRKHLSNLCWKRKNLVLNLEECYNHFLMIYWNSCFLARCLRFSKCEKLKW